MLEQAVPSFQQQAHKGPREVFEDGAAAAGHQAVQELITTGTPASQELVFASYHCPKLSSEKLGGPLQCQVRTGNVGQSLHGQVGHTGQAPAGDDGQTLQGQVSHTGQAPGEGVVVGQRPSNNLKFVPGQAPVEGEVVGQEPVSNVESVPEIDNNVIYSSQFDSNLSVDAATFVPSLTAHQYVIGTSTAAGDLLHVQEVQAGGVGRQGSPDNELRDGITSVQRRIHGDLTKDDVEHTLPFQDELEIPDMLGTAPKQVHKVNKLPDMVVPIPGGNFLDKVLPAPENKLVINFQFTPDYFVALHNICSMHGVRGDGTRYDGYTPNHIGARISLPHSKLKLDRWRYHLTGYENAELCQFLEFGFMLGLSSEPDLVSKSRNHGSAYAWYGYVDKFITTEVKECGVSGPIKESPWQNLVISPLMTAHKKPLARRTVFDASFGEGSLNGATPADMYMGEATKYTYPKIEDYRLMILKAGKGSFMWKRDLSRFYLQLPLDPTEYDKVAVVWRGLIFFFVALAFGLRHSGLQGQRVTDAVSWILRRLGLETGDFFFQVCNYVDDFGGVEETLIRANEAFEALGVLLDDLGLQESIKKAVSPRQEITYLGVLFNTITMEMSVPPEKLSEVKEEIRRWSRKTTISKRDLQSLLGKLFWVSKVIRYARAFMGRLLGLLRSAAMITSCKKVKFCTEAKKDIKWWGKYLEEFNGISMIINEDPIPLSYEQLMEKPHDIMAGDATPTGGGAWHGSQYWSQPLPLFLQDPQIGIHLKEFWTLIVSAKLWGDHWTGRTVVLYCDNDSVVETTTKRKPRDPEMASLLREFLYIVVTKKFHPVIRKIESKRNEIADFLSRRYDEAGAKDIFKKFGLSNISKIVPEEKLFTLTSDW